MAAVPLKNDVISPFTDNLLVFCLVGSQSAYDRAGDIDRANEKANCKIKSELELCVHVVQFANIPFVVCHVTIHSASS